MSYIPIFQIILIVLICIFAAVFVVVMFWHDPEYIFNLLGVSGQSYPKYESLKFLGIGIGGILFVLQVLMAYIRAKAIEDTAKSQAAAATAQARATEEQAIANKNIEKGQRQERLRVAIEHLGNDSDSVRLGGAYELFHLAQDTDELRQTVLDVLCAHIRQTTSNEGYRETYAWRPSEEIQSLLTLMFLQAHDVFKDYPIYLKGSWLNGVVLSAARLDKADLSWAWLKGADLRGAWLQGACLNETRLYGSDMYRANLQEANLLNAKLHGTILEAASLQCAILAGARLRGADLSFAALHGATLFNMATGGAHLQGAVLRNTEFHEADLRTVQSQGVGWELESGDTFGHRMRRSIGRESDLSLATFSGGLQSDHDVDSRVKGLSDETSEMMRDKLRLHIGKPRSHKPPPEDRVIVGAYNKQEAEKWIDFYEKETKDPTIYYLERISRSQSDASDDRRKENEH